MMLLLSCHHHSIRSVYPLRESLRHTLCVLRFALIDNLDQAVLINAGDQDGK